MRTHTPTNSQEVKTVIKRLHYLLNPLPHHECFLRTGLLRISLLLVGTDVHEELSDLVCVLTRSRYFDRTSPVEVEMAQSVGQVLQLLLCELRVILWHEEVCWQHTALSRGSGRQKEVKLLRLRAVFLNKTFVNNAP